MSHWNANHDGCGMWGIYVGDETKAKWSGKGRLIVAGLYEQQAKAIVKAYDEELAKSDAAIKALRQQLFQNKNCQEERK
jgi:hypothetical protein